MTPAEPPEGDAPLEVPRVFRPLAVLAATGLAALLFPLWSWLVFAALGAVVLDPAVTALEKKRVSRRTGAALVALALTLTLGLPVLFTGSHAVRGAAREFRLWREAHPDSKSLVDFGALRESVARWESVLPVSAEDLEGILQEGAKTALMKVGEKATQAMTQIPGAVTGFVILMLSLYFLLADGRGWAAAFLDKAPLGQERTAFLLKRLTALARSVVGASALSGSVQAVFFGLGLLLAGTPQTPSLVLATAFASFIPLVGATPVTLGAVVFFWLTKGAQTGGLLLVFALITGILDNFVRPWVLGSGEARVHPWVAFVSALAGVELFGMTGVFIGPVVAGLALAFWEFETS
jgi:predicted PurR-regulated permease PerM